MAAAAACATPEAHAVFVDVTPGTLLGSVTHGSAWLDYDGDGDLDLILTGITTSRLLRNDGGDSFVDATPAAWAASPNGTGVTVGDFDADGDADVFAAGNTVSNRLYQNQAGLLVDVAVPPISSATSIVGTAWIDHDADGDLDLLASNHNGANRLFVQSGGVFAAGSLPATGIYTRSFAVGDYDNDRDQDAFVCDPEGPLVRLLRNDSGTFVATTPVSLASVLAVAGSWGDFDNDGDLDLFAVGGGRTYFLRNDGGGTFVDVASGPFPFVGGYGITPVDYDNDGDLDVSIARLNGVVLVRNNGTGFASELSLVSSGFDMSWADYDGDGDLDLFASGPGQLFRNDHSAGAHWLHLHLVGTFSNRSAIGARVEVLAGGVRRIREVAGSTSSISQNSLDVEFGLGASTAVDSVIVRWPSGIVQVVPGLAVDARHTVIEEATTSAPEPAAGLGIVFAAPQPNPARDAVRFLLQAPEEGDAALAIHDVRGRLVARLAWAASGPGARSAAWNTRLDSGKPAPPGVYFARLAWTSSGGEVVERRRSFVISR